MIVQSLKVLGYTWHFVWLIICHILFRFINPLIFISYHIISMCYSYVLFECAYLYLCDLFSNSISATSYGMMKDQREFNIFLSSP